MRRVTREEDRYMPSAMTDFVCDISAVIKISLAIFLRHEISLRCNCYIIHTLLPSFFIIIGRLVCAVIIATLNISHRWLGSVENANSSTPNLSSYSLLLYDGGSLYYDSPIFISNLFLHHWAEWVCFTSVSSFNLGLHCACPLTSECTYLLLYLDIIPDVAVLMYS